MSPKKSTLLYMSILLPVYNEEENIQLQYDNIISNISHMKKTFEIIFVDDGSTDSSVKVINTIAKKDKRVKLIQFRRNFGQTAAMVAGIDHSRGEIVIFMDCDLQNDAKDIEAAVSKIDEGYDLVSGWRKNRKDKLFSRKIPSMIANKMIAKVSGVPLHDVGCSLKAYRGSLLRQVKLYGEMHRFIPAHLSWIGAKITEIPVTHHSRQFGTSKYGIKRTFKVLLDLITVKFLGTYSTKPIYVFGGVGFFLLVASILSGTAVVLMKIFMNTDMTGNPLLYLTILFSLLCVMFILLGILAEMLIRVYHESLDKPPYNIKHKINIS